VQKKSSKQHIDKSLHLVSLFWILISCLDWTCCVQFTVSLSFSCHRCLVVDLVIMLLYSTISIHLVVSVHLVFYVSLYYFCVVLSLLSSLLHCLTSAFILWLCFTRCPSLVVFHYTSFSDYVSLNLILWLRFA